MTVNPARDWSVTADLNLFWRLETEEGIYGPSGRLIRGASGSDERFVGSTVSLTSEYAIRERLTVMAIYATSFAGAFIKATEPPDAIDKTEDRREGKQSAR